MPAALKSTPVPGLRWAYQPRPAALPPDSASAGQQLANFMSELLAGVRLQKVLVICSADHPGSQVAVAAAAALARWGTHISFLWAPPQNPTAAQADLDMQLRQQLPQAEILKSPPRGRARREPDLIVSAAAPAAAALVAIVRAHYSHTPTVAIDQLAGDEPVAGTFVLGGYLPEHLLNPARYGQLRLCLQSAHTMNTLTPAVVAMELPAARAWWPVPREFSHKYVGGTTAIVAGSSRYPGAGVLAVGGAVNATSPMTYAVGAAASAAVQHYPSAVPVAELADLTALVQLRGVDCLVAGPGVGEYAAEILAAQALLQPPVLVLDADLLQPAAARVIAARASAGKITVVTPHHGELARLVPAAGEILRQAPALDPAAQLAAAELAAQQLGAVVLLKGPLTVVKAPGLPALLVRARGHFAATPGSGDVLAGMLGATCGAALASQPTCGQFPAPYHALAAGRVAYAAAAAACMHGAAADFAGVPQSAQAIVSNLSAVLAATAEYQQPSQPSRKPKCRA